MGSEAAKRGFSPSMSRLHKIYVLLFSVLGFGLGCLLGFGAGGILGLLAIGPMGALAGFSFAVVGRKILVAILELLT